jgi:hypothetical protein
MCFGADVATLEDAVLVKNVFTLTKSNANLKIVVEIVRAIFFSLVYT